MKFFVSFKFFFYAIVLSANSVTGQHDLRFTSLGTEIGLSNGKITSIVQDSLGFIWIGTKYGLNRYDGKNFKVYTQSNSNLSANEISDILIDGIGQMWIGTNGGGVNRYDLALDTFVSYGKSSSINPKSESDVVNSIFEDWSGIVWLATSEGLSYFDEQTKTFKTYLNESIPNDKKTGANDIICLYQNKPGVFLVGTNGSGVFLFDKETKSFSNYLNLEIKNKATNSLPDYILDIIGISNDSLLLGTNGNGLIGIDQKTGTLFDVFGEDRNSPEIVRTFWKDNESNIWVGTDGNGLYKLSPECKILQHYTRNTKLYGSIKGNSITTLFEDTQSNFWVGTAWRGLSVSKRETENLRNYFSDGKGYDPNPVLSIHKTKNSLWLGLDGKGLNRLNLNSQEVFKYTTAPLTLENHFVQCIEPTDYNKYWIGTFANGLILFDEDNGILQNFKREKNRPNSLPFDDVRDIIVTSSGNLWVATWGGGLSFFDYKEREFLNYRYSSIDVNSISSDNVISLFDDGSNLWMATHGGGLNKFCKENYTFKNFQTIQGDTTSIGSNYVYSIHGDKSDVLWLGTNQGISRFNKMDQTFENFEIDHDPNSNTVVSIVQDSLGFLWLGTRKGLFRFDPITNSAKLVPDTNTEFHINSAYMDESGKAYFGGIGGVTAIDTKIPFNSFKNPKLVFTDFKLFNKSLSPIEGGVLSQNIVINNKIRLKYDQNVITLGIAFLCYPSSTEYNFDVLMEGFEKEWQSIGEQSSVTYTNLSPGTYVFKARLSGTNLVDRTRSLRIEILPPPWKTPLAYLLYVLTFVAILYFARFHTLKWAEVKNNLRVEKLEREKEDKLHRLKQRFFTNISHEIRTPLTLIIGTLSSLKGKVPDSEQSKLNGIKSSANRLMTLVNELLNIRKLEAGNIKLQVTQNNLVTFIYRIFLAFSEQAVSNQIEYTFRSECETILVWFDKIQLEKSICNLLTNAFKFTPNKGRIEVILSSKQNYTEILVKDSGIGIPEDKLPRIFDRFYQNEDTLKDYMGFGIGLSVAKDIVELHQGKIQVKSAPKIGSSFKVRLPKGNEHLDSAQLNLEVFDEEQINTSNRNNKFRNLPSSSKDEIVILVVEDNRFLREYLRELLSNEYKIITAKDGLEGRDFACEHVPDLILSDVMMPNMDGVTMCHTLKTNMLTSHIPIILLTAKDMDESIIEGYETGADEYLIKPFHEGILKSIIKNLIGIRQQLRERYSKELLLNPKDVAFISPDEEFLSKLQFTLEEKMRNPEFHINELARDMAMSHSGIYKKLKALTGMTLVAYIRDYRLKRASQILKQHRYAIADVSFMVGFTDRKHFSQEFKKKFGKTPSEFSKNHA